MAGRRSLEEIERDFVEARRRGDGLPIDVRVAALADDVALAGAAAWHSVIDVGGNDR